MPSSPARTRAVDPIEGNALEPPTDAAPSGASGKRRKPNDAQMPAPRYSPAVLMVHIVNLLRSQGLTVSETYQHGSEAMQASADLLRWLGVQPDPSAIRPPVDHGPVVVAASVLLRAAGIEPNAILAWPGRPA